MFAYIRAGIVTHIAGTHDEPSAHFDTIVSCDGTVTVGMLWDGADFMPPPQPNLSAAKASAWDRIKTRRDEVKRSGVHVSGKWFHSDDSSRIQQLGLVMMGANVPAVAWKTMDGSFTTMSQALAMGIFQAVATLDMQAFASAETHRTAMEASADPASYDFSTGWPEVFAS